MNSSQQNLEIIQRELQPESEDLVVVPEDMELPSEVPFLVYKLKHLLKPSIIKDKGNFMEFIDRLKKSAAEYASAGFSSLYERLASKEEATKCADCNDCGCDSSETGEDLWREKKPDLSYDILPRFYRHVRGIDWNYEEYFAKGGLTLLVELDPANSVLKFSYAICNEKDLFNKGIATSICSKRMNSNDSYVIDGYNGDLTVVENIYFAIKKSLNIEVNNDIIESPEEPPKKQRIISFSMRKKEDRINDFRNIVNHIEEMYDLEALESRRRIRSIREEVRQRCKVEAKVWTSTKLRELQNLYGPPPYDEEYHRKVSEILASTVPAVPETQSQG